jgi:DNA transposition AAA+ family ATPase
MVLEQVRERHPSEPGIILIHGAAGTGKTISLTYLAVQSDAICVTMSPLDTRFSAIGRIAREAGVRPARSAAATYDLIAEALAVNPRSIFVDESDFLPAACFEAIRVLHDLIGIPVVLACMPDLRDRLGRMPHMTRRIAAEVEFGALSIEDAQLVTAELMEVQIGGDLVERFHRKSKGLIAGFCRELAEAEVFARRRGLGELSAANYLVEQRISPAAAA